MQNKWHLTFLERFSTKKTFGCICHISGPPRSILMIDTSFEPLEPIESKEMFLNPPTRYHVSHLKVTQTPGLTFSSVFLVVMPLNTTFDQKTAKVRRICRFGCVKLCCVLSGFAFPALSFGRTVMILIPLESVEYLVCADPINNKVFLVLC